MTAADPIVIALIDGRLTFDEAAHTLFPRSPASACKALGCHACRWCAQHRCPDADLHAMWDRTSETTIRQCDALAHECPVCGGDVRVPPELDLPPLADPRDLPAICPYCHLDRGDPGCCAGLFGPDVPFCDPPPWRP